MLSHFHVCWSRNGVSKKDLCCFQKISPAQRECTTAATMSSFFLLPFTPCSLRWSLKSWTFMLCAFSCSMSRRLMVEMRTSRCMVGSMKSAQSTGRPGLLPGISTWNPLSFGSACHPDKAWSSLTSLFAATACGVSSAFSFGSVESDFDPSVPGDALGVLVLFDCDEAILFLCFPQLLFYFLGL